MTSVYPNFEGGLTEKRPGISPLSFEWKEFRKKYLLPDSADSYCSLFLPTSAVLEGERRLLSVLDLHWAGDAIEHLSHFNLVAERAAIPFAHLINGDSLLVSLDDGIIHVASHEVDEEGGFQLFETSLTFAAFAERVCLAPELLVDFLEGNLGPLKG